MKSSTWTSTCPDPDNELTQLSKYGKRFSPVQFMDHGLFGEYNVNLDPAEVLRQLMDGMVPDPWEYCEAYYGWLSVVNVSQNIAGVSKTDEEDENQTAGELEMDDDEDEEDDEGPERQSSQRRRTGRRGRRRGRRGRRRRKRSDAEVSVEVELDVSLPKLIKAALEPDENNQDKGGGRIFKSAQIHMCTTAQLDTSFLSPGQGNPATFLLAFLGKTLRFNIIPFLTMTLKDVQIRSVDFSIAGDSGSNTPTVQLSLSYTEITYTYHVINASNMSLFHVDYHYKVGERGSPAEMKWSVLNPFA